MSPRGLSILEFRFLNLDLANTRRDAVGTRRPEAYATLLDQLGYVEQSVRVQVYPHRLQSRDDVFEWLRGTLLTDYEKRMPAELFARFLEAFRARIRSWPPCSRSSRSSS